MRFLSFIVVLLLTACSGTSVESAYDDWSAQYASSEEVKKILPNLAESYINNEAYRKMIAADGAREFLFERITSYLKNEMHRKEYPYDWFLIYGYVEICDLAIEEEIGRPGDLESAAHILELCKGR